MKIEFTDKIEDSDKKIVENGLRSHNLKFAPDDNHKELAVFLKDENGEIVGGLLGGTYWNWLHIDIFWIEESIRGGGYGTKMLKAVEKEAIRRGCGNAHLDTHDFQALSFYQKHGYEICGQLDDLPKGHKRYLLKKSLINKYYEE